MPKTTATIFILVISTLLVLILVRGQIGLYNQLHFQYDYDIVRGGPFEASNSNSRYALTETIVENGTLFFTDEQIEFTYPDIVYHQGRYFSIFTPGISFLGVPFYMIGVLAGAPQLFTFLSTIFLAVLNLYLVYKIANKLGVGKYTSLFAGLAFLFTTNAIAYSLTYTQHHLSTAMILSAVLNAIDKRNWKNNLGFGIIFGISLLADIPNGLMLLPVLGYVIWKNFDSLTDRNKIGFTLNWKIIGLALGVIPLFIVFGLYNYALTGSYTTLGQAIGRASHEQILTPEKPEQVETPEESNIKLGRVLEFEDVPRGLYILLISNERGWMFYSPAMILGVFALYLFSKRNNLGGVILAVIGADILVYSMFGDPWGGWAFGPRYLIPATALASVGLGLAIERFKKKIAFSLLLLVLLVYGLSVSILGAMTTNNIPPKIEAIHLQNPIPYTYILNWQILETDKSSSLFYDVYLKDLMTAKNFYFIYVSIVAAWLVGLYSLKVRPEKNNIQNNA